jgi:hypothetical protein
MAQLLKMLVYSPAGHGKTVLLGSAAGDDRLCPMLLIDFEGGIDSILSKVREIQLDEIGKIDPQIDKIDVVRVYHWTEFDRAYDLLSKSKTYKTVAIDSLSELNYLNLTEITAQAIKADSRHDPDNPQREDYGRSSTQMRRLIRQFRDLPLHCILTCGAKEEEDAKSRKSQVRPNLTGKLTNEVPGLVSTLGYLAIVEDQQGPYRALICQPDERFMAKDRSEGGKLGTIVAEPTLPYLLDLLEGKAVIGTTEETTA